MSASYAMARRAVLRIDDEPGTVIHVWWGALWITQEGDARDYYVTAGQSFTVSRDGAALATAMSRAQVSVTPPAPRENRAQRLVNLLARLALPRAA